MADAPSITDPMLPRPFRVVDLYPETDEVSTLTFEPADSQPSYIFGPAQIGMVGIPGLGEVPVSFSSDPADRTLLAMTIRRAGAITTALLELTPGDVVSMRGPYGTEWPMRSANGRHLLVVAGGLGMAPLRSAVVSALGATENFRSVTVIYGARSPGDHLFRRDLSVWSEDDRIRLLLTVDQSDPSWSGRVGLVTGVFDEAIGTPNETCAMVCGPDVMLKAVSEDLVERGLPARHVWLTMERNMKCGIGLCGHCQFGRYFLCKDGPVMSWLEVGALYQVPEV